MTLNIASHNWIALALWVVCDELARHGFDAVLGEVSPVVNRMGRTLPCGKNSSPVMARQDF